MMFESFLVITMITNKHWIFFINRMNGSDVGQSILQFKTEKYHTGHEQSFMI